MKKNLKSLSFYIILFMIILLLVSYLYSAPATEEKYYSDLVHDVQSGVVTKLVVVDDVASVTLIDKTQYDVTLPSKAIFHSDLWDSIKKQIDAGTLIYDPQPTPTVPWWLSMLPGFVLVILFIGFFPATNASSDS